MLSYQNLLPADLLKLSLGQVRELMYRNRVEAVMSPTKAIKLDKEDLKRKTRPEFKPLVIVGPSGAGKGTLIHAFRDPTFCFSVSSTTRDPRPGEINGVHYNFMKVAEFEAQIQ